MTDKEIIEYIDKICYEYTTDLNKSKVSWIDFMCILGNIKNFLEERQLKKSRHAPTQKRITETYNKIFKKRS